MNARSTAWPLFATLLLFAPVLKSGAQDRNVKLAPIAASAARHALVIGNAAYAEEKLKNPVNDARAMAKLFAELGFSVDLREDIDQRQMEEAIRDHGRKLRGGGVGIFFFAGHGVQVNGANYLIPTGAGLASETDIKYKTVPLGYLLDHLGEANNQLNIVLLDACRNNPFRSFRTLQRGLAQADAPTGTLIGYATAPGKVAADGVGEHSPFTEQLLRFFREEGTSIEEVLKKTRAAVKRATGQVPWMSTSLTGEFIPRPRKAEPPPPIVVAKPPTDGEFSLDDLKAWRDRLSKMKKAFEEAEAFDQSASEAPMKIVAWQRFLQAFSTDDPFSRDDDGWRQQAGSRVQRLQEDEKKRQLSPEAVPPPLSITSTTDNPGDIQPGEAVETLQELGMVFRFVPKGEFQMGSPENEKGRFDDEKRHRVELSRAFAIAETEVTQRQWQVLMGTNPARFTGCNDCPVEQVNWYEALAFANELSMRRQLEPCYELSGGNGKKAGEGLEYETARLVSKQLACTGYRLPTEAEWEYAARAGTPTATYGGDLTALECDSSVMDRLAWYCGNAGGKTHPVGDKQANDWQLHDMLGNVWEWTQDSGISTYEDFSKDPVREGGPLRVLRGGSWFSHAWYCRAANRSAFSPGYRFAYIGFRLVRTLP